MKVGKVALVGRPNTGKSTLVNGLIGQKVSIMSPKPQTTHFSVLAVYEDERGQIVFVDTPGVFAKVSDGRAREVNLRAESAIQAGVDAVLYVIDHTRSFGVEEEKVFSMLTKVFVPKILVVNKIDVLSPDYSKQYESMKSKFDTVVEISALKEWHLDDLLRVLFEKLPEGEPTIDTKGMPFPVLNMDSRMYIEEIIREKAFLLLWDELPYSIRVQVDDIEERDEQTTYIKAKILTSSLRYKKMIIGKDAAIVKEIGMTARKELMAATGRKVYLDLKVEVG